MLWKKVVVLMSQQGEISRRLAMARRSPCLAPRSSMVQMNKDAAPVSFPEKGTMAKEATDPPVLRQSVPHTLHSKSQKTIMGSRPTEKTQDKSQHRTSSFHLSSFRTSISIPLTPPLRPHWPHLASVQFPLPLPEALPALPLE